MTPPTLVSVMASRRNCARMSLPRAPTALRTPISLVRSVTLMSMMFITPIPPTNRPMEAMMRVRATMALVRFFQRSVIRSGEVISKSLGLAAGTWRRRRRTSTAWSWAALIIEGSEALTAMTTSSISGYSL